MQIKLNSVFVDDQDRALAFYTDVLGFAKCADVPIGDYRWLTVTAPEGYGDVELVLEPNDNPAAQAFQQALVAQNVPITAFLSTDIHAETARLKERGVVFRSEPTDMGMVTLALFEDTCGNLIHLYQPGERP